MPSSDARQDVVARLLGAIRGVRPGERALVGVDGVDGSGKTMLARELVARAATGGREVHAVSMDGFHRPRAERYAAGRDGRAYYEASYRYDVFVARVSRPWRDEQPALKGSKGSISTPPR